MGRNLYVEDIDEDLWELLDADSRTKKDIVEAALWSEFGGRKKSALEAKKQHKLEQLQAIEKEIESEKEDKQRVRSEIEALESKIQRMDEQQVSAIDFVDQLLDKLEDGDIRHLVPDVITSQDGYQRLDEGADELHDLAKERAVDQERTLRESHFMTYEETQAVNGMTDLVTEAWGDDDE